MNRYINILGHVPYLIASFYSPKGSNYNVSCTYCANNDSWLILTFNYSGKSVLQCFPTLTYIAFNRCKSMRLCDLIIVVVIQLVGAGGYLATTLHVHCNNALKLSWPCAFTVFTKRVGLLWPFFRPLRFVASLLAL